MHKECRIVISVGNYVVRSGVLLAQVILEGANFSPLFRIRPFVSPAWKSWKSSRFGGLRGRRVQSLIAGFATSFGGISFGSM